MFKNLIPIISIGLCLSLFLPVTVFADADDTPAGAVVLAPNSSSGGSLTEITDETDWWKITTTFDGSLVVNTTSDLSLDLDLKLFDQDGTTQIASYDTSTGIHEATHRYNLAAGTYYVKAYRWLGTGGSYSISNIFNPTSLAIDSEPNDSSAIAQTLAPNSSTTGHLGYYGNLYIDEFDWWKITTTFDGSLIVNTTSESTLDLDLHMYDQDGSTQIASYDTSTGIHEATHRYDLSPGTYYIKANRWIGYGSYTISNIFTPTGLANDPEPNDTVEISSTLALNDSTTGHLGYFKLGNYDEFDWWKVALPGDGNLTVRTRSDASLDLDMHMFDVNGVSQIASYDIGTGQNEATHYYGLKAGTYYVKANRWIGYGSYHISSQYTAAQLANDSEPNDIIGSAQPIFLNSQSAGHLGFFGNGATDLYDFYSFTLASPLDTLFIRTDSDPTIDIDLKLYNQSGSEIASSSATGSTELLVYQSIAAGSYSVRLARYNGYGSYGVIVASTRPNTPLLDVKGKGNDLITPKNFALAQNFPNPFNPSTNIQFQIPVSGHVTLKVYNLLGCEIATLINETKPAGFYNFNWNASNLPSGVYFYQLSVGKFVEVRKAVLLK